MDHHLTTPAPGDLNALMSASPAGMAFAAGTGPSGETCRTCAHWRRGKRPSYDVRTERSKPGQQHTGELRPKPCEMYSRLMLRGAIDITGQRVPAATSCCRYFETLPGDVTPDPLKFKTYEAARMRKLAEAKIRREEKRKSALKR